MKASWKVLTEDSGSYLLALLYWRSLRGLRKPETQMNLEKAPVRKHKMVVHSLKLSTWEAEISWYWEEIVGITNRKCLVYWYVSRVVGGCLLIAFLLIVALLAQFKMFIFLVWTKNPI